MKKESINPAQLFNSRQYGFSQAISASAGRIVFISGQVAWDENQNIIGKGNLKAQTERSIQNLQAAIEAAGGTLGDITMIRIYTVESQNEDMRIVAEALTTYFGTDSPPASTWIKVAGLASEDFMIEIEAQAVI